MSAPHTPPQPTLPRIELHCHLDGSVRPETLRDLAREEGRELPEPIESIACAPPSCASLVEYIAAIDCALDVLQTPEALERVTRELCEDWVADGVVHGEVRFAPQLHERRGMTRLEAIEAVHRGLERARLQFPTLGTSLIVCCLRHLDPEINEEVVEVAANNRHLVDGIDLAGGEAGNPGRDHLAAFEIAHRVGLRVTVHAGEAAGPESVREALDLLGAERIGHGVRSIGDPALVERLAAEQIALECCPTSNVQTRAITIMSEHPIDQLLEAGVPVTVSTDCRTVSSTTLEREWEILHDVFGWQASHHRRCQLHAARAAFVDETSRLDIEHHIESGHRAVLSKYPKHNHEESP